MSSVGRRRHGSQAITAAAAAQQQNGSVPSTAARDLAQRRERSDGKRVLVLGGTGRVGASTVSALLKVLL